MKASHKQLANWYLQLSQHMEAGITLPEALTLAKGPHDRDRQTMANQLHQGESIAAVLQQAPAWLPIADRAFIAAASEIGHLPQTCLKLHARHEQMHNTKMKVVLASLYPMAVFHAGVLLLPVIRMIDFEKEFIWNTQTYLQHVATFMLPVWASIVLILYLAKSDSRMLPRILRTIPFLRKFSKNQALADFSFSLGGLLEAGLPTQAAWQCASKVTNDIAIQKATSQLSTTFDAGQNPATKLENFKCFPSEFKAFYKSGSESGQLDRSLHKAGQIYQDKANSALTTAAVLYPTLLFLIVAAFVVYAVFTCYDGYLQLFEEFK